MADAVLSIESLSAGYDQAAVIRDLDLRVGSGEVVALLGPNGAGKTTTLRAVSGIVKPMAGRIVLDGLDLARSSPSSRAGLGIAHVPEGRGLFFGLTVAEHFRVGPRRRAPRRDGRVRVLPEPPRPAAPARGPAVRRRAADARRRAGARAPPEAVAARRA